MRKYMKYTAYKKYISYHGNSKNYGKSKTYGKTIFAYLIVLLVLSITPFSSVMGASIGETERIINAFLKDLERVEENLKRPNMNRAEIELLRVELENIHTESTKLNNKITPQVEDLAKRLEQLAPSSEPASTPIGEVEIKESENVVREREELTKQLARLENAQKQLEFLALSARQFSDRAAAQQREIFFSDIFQPTKSIINPNLWIDGLVKAQPLFVRVWRLGESTISQLDFSALQIIFALSALLFTFLAAFPLRQWFMRMGAPRDKGGEHAPDQLQRLWRVAWFPIATTLSFLPLFFVGTVFIDHISERHYQLSELIWAILISVLIFIAISSFIKAILSPKYARWRLVDLSDAQAKVLFWLLKGIIFIFVFSYFMGILASILFLPVQLVIMYSGVSSLITMIVLSTALILMRPKEPQADKTDKTDTINENPSHEDMQFSRAGFHWVARLRFLLWLIICATVISLLIGYIALAAFITKQLTVTALLIAALYIFHHLADELIDTGFRHDRAIGHFLRHTIGCSARTVDNLGIVLGVLGDMALIFIGLPLIIVQWAVTWVDIKSWLLTLFLGFKVGDVDISLLTVVILIAALICGLAIARIFTRWIDRRVLKRTHMNRGVRDSLYTAVRYVGIAAAVTFALFISGVDFSNIAIVAGALSIGIGFGLQSIVNNFVSGLILLAERPIKVGDWISVAGGEGYVQQINVRSTEIQTFDRCSVIVPNSTLISETVSNWTHADTMGRVRVEVGVGYDSNPQQVREILLECARKHQLIINYPAPTAYFVNFGESSLDFSLRGYIADVNYVLSVTSDLRFAIYEAFKEANIEIPFPQRDIHIKGAEEKNDAESNIVHTPPSSPD